MSSFSSEFVCVCVTDQFEHIFPRRPYHHVILKKIDRTYRIFGKVDTFSDFKISGYFTVYSALNFWLIVQLFFLFKAEVESPIDKVWRRNKNRRKY